VPLRENWKIARTVFLADTTLEAENRARKNTAAIAHKYLARAIQRGPGLGVMKRDLESPDSEVDMDYFMKELIIAGDVDTVLERLLGLWEETGPFGTLVMMEFDWVDDDDKRAWLHSTELFSRELLPRFNKAVGANAGA
jgi:alkanesulfonate monooxygenase SsuD/methylene tetrahydromethanopterin reductase-like flavin-dependent oxidoreductase (luciferase family)